MPARFEIGPVSPIGDERRSDRRFDECWSRLGHGRREGFLEKPWRCRNGRRLGSGFSQRGPIDVGVAGAEQLVGLWASFARAGAGHLGIEDAMAVGEDDGAFRQAPCDADAVRVLEVLKRLLADVLSRTPAASPGRRIAMLIVPHDLKESPNGE
ncbi:MAG: hypothetical protein ACREE0_00415 [Phenylobacterium sp.]